MTDEKRPEIWEDEAADELILRYIALRRKHELMEEYEHYAQLAEEEHLESSPELDAAIHAMTQQMVKDSQKVKKKHRYRKGISVAAILCLMMLACPAIAFAVSPSFRINVMDFISDWQDDHVSIQLGGQSSDWVPEGFELVNEYSDDTFTILDYKNDSQYVHLRIKTSFNDLTLDNEKTAYSEEYLIDGKKAIVTEGIDKVTVVWHDDRTLFHMTTNLSKETALEMVKHIQ